VGARAAEQRDAADEVRMANGRAALAADLGVRRPPMKPDGITKTALQALSASAILAVMVVGCGPSTADRIAAIPKGTTRVQVVAMLGEPEPEGRWPTEEMPQGAPVA
jgi:hypothetical protein